MVFKKKLTLMLVVLGIIFLFITGITLALSLPLPPNTRVIREETIETAGEEKQITFCESELGEEKLSVFYRRQLESRGYSIFLQQKNLMIYLKGEDMVMVMLMSADNQKTNIVLTTGRTAQGSPGESLKPQTCEDIPSVPVYPEARCMGSSRMKKMRAEVVRYSAPAEIKDVLDFYRVQMQQNSWNLEKELAMADYLPQEALSGSSSGVSLNLQGATQLNFTNSQNARCMVTLMPAFTGTGTLINIVYEQAKE